jgi:DNA-binding beta-propeller fold protein YncE
MRRVLEGGGGRRPGRWRALALAAALVAGLDAAAVCTPPSVAEVVPAPAVSPLRSYRVDFTGPIRLAPDAAGNLYVTDPGHGEVLVRAPDGRVLARRTGLGSPVSVAVHPSGAILVGDGAAGRVTAYGPDWRPRFELGRGAGELGQPADIAVSAGDGAIYVTDSRAHQVKVYEANGLFRLAFGGQGAGDGQFQTPTGVFVDDARGEMLVSDQLNYRIQVFDLQGTFRHCLRGEPGSFFGSFTGGGGRPLASPQGLWVDAAGRIYVADAFNGRVLVMDRGGRVLRLIGDFGQAPGQLRVPMDLALDPAGRLFVSAANNARLEVYGIDAYTDPEAVAPALLTLAPALIQRAAPPPAITAHLEVPGHRLEELDPATVTANGLPALWLGNGDADGDGIADAAFSLDSAALLATLPPAGPGTVTVSGQLGALSAEGSALLEIRVPDLDGDGVADTADACPGTAPGAVVNAAGCSPAQLCPCAGPRAGGRWRNHGEYLRCVILSTQPFVRERLMTPRARTELLRRAGASACGQPAGARP